MAPLERGRFEADLEQQTKKLGASRGLLKCSKQVSIVVPASCPSARVQTEHLSDSDPIGVGERANRDLVLRGGIECSKTR
jgi:hypothetical protein